MPIPFPKYASIKDECCLCYFGNCLDYVTQLKYLRPVVEKELPGINISLCVGPQAFDIIKDEPRVISTENIKDMKMNFAFILELSCNMIDHPVEKMLLDSQLKIKPFKSVPNNNKKACIVTKGILPTRSLNEAEIALVINKVRTRGYEPLLNQYVDVGWVIGVESPDLYDAAFQGIPTTLIPTGIGTSFYQNIIAGEVLKLS